MGKIVDRFVRRGAGQRLVGSRRLAQAHRRVTTITDSVEFTGGLTSFPDGYWLRGHDCKPLVVSQFKIFRVSRLAGTSQELYNSQAAAAAGGTAAFEVNLGLDKAILGKGFWEILQVTLKKYEKLGMPRC